MRNIREFAFLVINLHLGASAIAEVVTVAGVTPQQYVPMSLVSSIPFWTLEEKRRTVTEVSTARSLSELSAPGESARLCLGILFKDGAPRYVMPLVDVALSQESEGASPGLSIAHTWLPFDSVLSRRLSISAYVNTRAAGGNVDAWFAAAEQLPLENALGAAMRVLAEAPERWKEGFHCLAVGLGENDRISLPPASRLRVFLNDYPAPVRLLELEGGTDGGELDVAIAPRRSA